MTERVDNTKGMATVGRIALTVIVVSVWAASQLVITLATAESVGREKHWVVFIFLLGNAFFSMLAVFALEDIWKGPLKKGPP